VALGDYNMSKFEGAVNIPLNDVAAIRVAGSVHKRDGYTKNDLTGQKFDGISTESLRASFLLKPTSQLSSHTILDYLKDDGSPNSGLLTRVYPGGGSSYNSAISPSPSNATANAFALLAAQQARGPRHAAIVLGTNSPLDYFSPANCVGNRKCRDGMPRQEVINWGFLNNTEYEFNPDLRLKNILSYRYASEMTTGNNYSPGALTAIGTQSNLADDVSQWSEEIQLSGKALDGKLDWATGYFTMREWGKDRTYTASFSATAPVQQVPGLGNGPWNANWTGSWGDGETRSTGIYAQGTYQLADRLKGTLGIRHNTDKKRAVDTSPRNNAPPASWLRPIWIGRHLPHERQQGVQREHLYREPGIPVDRPDPGLSGASQGLQIGRLQPAHPCTSEVRLCAGIRHRLRGWHQVRLETLGHAGTDQPGGLPDQVDRHAGAGEQCQYDAGVDLYRQCRQGPGERL
jgi:iron complex outermembrane receptor protein